MKKHDEMHQIVERVEIFYKELAHFFQDISWAAKEMRHHLNAGSTDQEVCQIHQDFVALEREVGARLARLAKILNPMPKAEDQSFTPVPQKGLTHEVYLAVITEEIPTQHTIQHHILH